MRGLCRLASLSRSQSLTLTVLARSYPPLTDKPQRPLPFVLSKPLCALARCHPAALLWLLTLKTLQYTSQIVEPVLIAVLAVALGTYEASVTQAAAVYLGFKAAALAVQCAADWNQFGAMPVRVNKSVGTWAVDRLMAAPIALMRVGKLQSIAAGADTSQLAMACITAFQIAAILARIVASAALQITMVGIEGWGAGVGVVLLGLLLQDGLRRLARRLALRAQASEDATTSALVGICNDLRLYKLQGWEAQGQRAFFSRRVMQARTIVRQNTFETLMPIASQMVAFGSPVVALLVGQAASGAWPSPANAWAYWFLAMQNLDMFNQLAGASGLWAKISASLRRIVVFSSSPLFQTVANARAAQGDAELRLAGAEYAYTTAAGPATALWAPALRVPAGALALVVGPTGGGKTSLLLALCGELARSPAVDPPADSTATGRQGLKAYCAQRPVLFLGTVRDNIVFGRSYDAVAYQSAIAACGLDVDLRLLADSDSTTVGSAGGSLSGGQQMRVALARGVYALLLAADMRDCLFVADNPLAALDAKVADELWVRLTRALSRATLVLSTSDALLEARAEVTMVVTVCAGRLEVRDIGAGRGLLASSTSKSATTAPLPTTPGHVVSQRRRTAILNPSGTEAAVPLAGLFSEAKRDAGSGVRQLARLLGVRFVAALLASFSAAKGAILVTNMAAAAFVGDSASAASPNTDGGSRALPASLRLGATLMGALAASCTIALMQSVLIAVHGSRIVTRVSVASLRAVLHAPVSTTGKIGSGEVTARLSGGLRHLNTLMQVLNGFFDQFFLLASALLYVLPAFPHSLLPVGAGMAALAMAAFLVHARLALPTSKLLGRCRAQAQPLVHQVLFQTANGLAEIRAFEAQAEMRRRFADVQRRALVSSEANQLWTFVVLLGGCQFISWVYAVAAIGVMVACSRASCFEESGMGTSAPGFILIGVRSLGDFSKTLVAQFVPVENAAIALERALEFTHGLPQEAPHSRAADAALPPGWPAGAALVFTNLSLRYAPELPPSLVAMSLAVRAGERVGIVGRSGAGKSTVLAALLRLVEGERGCIRLAGIDVTMVGLGTLRRRAAVVGQEPAFCDGSLRLNLDADGTRTDDELWELLAACRLDAVVRVLPELLGTAAGATGLSRGQLQLLCVVRALAKRAPLLLLDEATSALDDATERAMQAALDAAAAAGAPPTTLAIAHRLRTIVEYEKVLVMEAGRAIEYGAPRALARLEGCFAELAALQALS